MLQLTPPPSLLYSASTLAYPGKVANGGTASSFTFNGTAIGAAATAAQRTRTLVLFATATSSSVTGITVDGVAATPVAEAIGPDAATSLRAFVIPWNNANTTANIVVTMSASGARCTLAVFAAYGLSQPTVPLDVFALGDFSTGSTWNGTLRVASGGVVPAFIWTQGSGGPASGYAWTNLTEQDDTLLAGTHRTSAAMLTTPITAPNGAFTFSAVCSGTPGNAMRSLIALSFR